MNGLTGTGSLIRLILRRDRLTLPAWTGLLAFVVIATAAGFAQLYPDPQGRQALAATVVGNPALLSLVGPLYDTSIGGLTAWRIGGIMALLVGLVSLIIVIRHTRTEEEAGRRELLGSTVVGRHAQLSAALAMTCGANLALAALVAAGLMGLGLPSSGSVALGLSLAASGWMFTAVAGVTAQLAGSAGAARGIAVIVLGLSFLLRVAGDGAGEGGRLAWLSWLSPIGWAQRVRPFAGESWWPFVLFIGSALALTATAYALSSRRDIGSGMLPQRLGPATGSPGLRSPLALAWRLQRGGLIAWIAGFAVMGLVIGGVAQSLSEILRSAPQLEGLFARIGGQAILIDAFFSTTMGLFALVASAYSVQAALRLRTEEEGQRAEPVLATSVGRLSWATSHLVFAVIGPAVLLAVVGLTAGLTYGLSIGDVGRDLPRVLAAGMVQLPAVWVLTGIAVALYGLLPRLASLIWAALVVFLLLGQVGQMLQLSQWLLNMSPFTHVPAVLVGNVSLAPLVWLLGAAVLLTAAGLAGFRRRDVGRG